MRAVVLSSLLLGCGGSSSPTPSQTTRPPAELTAMPAGSRDVQVATVNGKPVYGSCVTTQAARGATKQAALDQCIEFELLAQHAEAHATDPDVVYETRTALVNQFVAREYEDKFTRPADFGAFWDKAIERNKQLVDHGEARRSAYLRIPVSKTATPEQEQAARAIAEELATRLAGERGLMAPHLEQLGKEIVGTRGTVEFAVVPPYLETGGLVKPYEDALFAVPEVGRTSAAIKTDWGWDIVLLTELIPAEKLSPAEIATKLLPEVKRGYFPTWARQIAATLSVKLFEENVPKLEDL